MKITKLFGKHTTDVFTIVTIIGFVALFTFLYKYNKQKGLIHDSMRSQLAPSVIGTPDVIDEGGRDGPPLGNIVGVSDNGNNDYLNVSGIETTKQPQQSCNDQPVMDPKDLLPSDSNTEWSNIAPSKELANIPFIDAGHHIGVNTIGSSLRNPNLQVRSEPVIPQTNTGPWNNTTIEPDTSRKSLEIGYGGE